MVGVNPAIIVCNAHKKAPTDSSGAGYANSQ